MLDALRSMLPWPAAARLDELAPEKMPIPSGGTRPIDWSGPHPVLTLRVQQAFGWTDTPRLVDGRVPLVLHLTDPAGRPAAVTSDLTSFWAGPYRDVRAQLRGRYPKHPWPEDPLHAAHEPRQAAELADSARGHAEPHSEAEASQHGDSTGIPLLRAASAMRLS